MNSRLVLVAICLVASPAVRADDLADQIRALDPRVLPDECPWGKPTEMLAKDIRARFDMANKRETEKWQALRSKDDWESYSWQPTEIKLGNSLGQFLPPHRE